MVKLYSLSILYKGPQVAMALKAAHDLSSFGFFQRSSVQEFMTFTSKIIVERTSPAARQSVKESGLFWIDTAHQSAIGNQCKNVCLFLHSLEYLCHVYVRSDNLAGVLISDHEYPHRVAHSLLTKVRICI